MIAELDAERDRLTQAIEVLERLSSEEKGHRRRTPPTPKKEEPVEPPSQAPASV